LLTPKKGEKGKSCDGLNERSESMMRHGAIFVLSV